MASKPFPVKLLRNYRPENASEKIAAGSSVELPLDVAKKLIELGIAERADDLPNED